jgi:hypothetical protein
MIGYHQFLSEDEVEWFSWYWRQLPSKIDTNQRMRSPAHFQQTFFARQFEKLRAKVTEVFPNEEITTVNLNWDYLPGGIHTDGYIDYDKEDKMGHTFLIPLEMKNEESFQTVIFEGISDKAVSLNRELGLGDDGLVTYPQVSRSYFDFKDTPFDKKMHSKYLDHLDYNALKGIKVNKVLKWQLGRAMIWPRNQLHCSANFKPNSKRSTLLIATKLK